MKRKLFSLLNERSLHKVSLHPSRRNTIHAALVILGAVPVAIVMLPILVLCRLLGRRLKVVVVAPEGAFSFFVSLMELLRSRIEEGDSADLVLVLDKWGHRTLNGIYSAELGARVVSLKGVVGLLQQALLLQPSYLVELERLDWRDLRKQFRLSNRAIKAPQHLKTLVNSIKTDLGLSGRGLIAMSVYTLEYDEERAPFNGYSTTRVRLETIGSELTAGIDFLRSQEMDVVILGSPDTGKARISRNVPRLRDFGWLGGPHEVAIASELDYFWSDAVGAWWVSFPFRKPVLLTNQYSLRMGEKHLSATDVVCVPVRFCDAEGNELTLRQELEAKPPFSKRNDLNWIRNSPKDIVDAHNEMLARVRGEYEVAGDGLTLHRRYYQIFEDFPQFLPLRVTTSFLLQHPHWLS